MQDFIALGDLSSIEMSFHLLALTFNSLREKICVGDHRHDCITQFKGRGAHSDRRGPQTVS